MAVPGFGVSFKEFAKNPIVALLFMALMAIGYLYHSNQTNLENQIIELREELDVLKKDYKELNDAFIETIRTINEEEQ